ncbi:MAG: putative selenium-dependent hydroxylase accessory protein YqeC [Mogibacterium sp.]|nr:putative selenium-dependent hydroxylase accessory protein YqeC [Mogibacterium sp.]MBQ6500947.1 putative selenium-dependent hydroxylase accessory protein YqeC [Mogibacterium sp.]
MDLWNFKGKQNNITDALQIRLPEHAVISVTGAGGKTSLIFAWARELAAAGKSVVITTTTHMYRPERMEEGGIRIVVSDDPERPDKVMAPPDDVLNSLRETADVVFIEADGSRRMPLKWPAPWEPVIPDYTDFTVCVAGLSSLGRSTADVVYRADELPDRLKREIVDMNLIHAVLSSRDGGQKGVRGEFRVFMNQVDDDTDRLAAAFRLQQIFAVLGIQSAWGTLLEEPKIAVILEAAGNSSRFGSNKLLHIMDDGRPMAAPIFEAARSVDAYKKILVTQYDDVAAMAPDFDVVMNDRPDLGISRSMQLGLRAAGDADAYMFCVCDQPGITKSTLERLIGAYKKGTVGIVSLAWQGKMCNPKIFSSRYREELMALSGDTGGRQIIASHTDDLLPVEADSEDEVRDIDSL